MDERDDAQATQGVRPPRQRRTRELMERVFEAAEQLFAEHGFEQTSMAQIAKQAGTSVGAIYRRFQDKEALLQALDTRFHERSLALLAADSHAFAGATGADLGQLVRVYVRLSVQQVNRNQGYHRAAYQRSLTDPEFAAREVQLRRALTERMHGVLLSRRDQIRHPQPEVAADFAVRQIMAVISQRFAAAVLDVGVVELDEEAFIEQTARAALSYLGVS